MIYETVKFNKHTLRGVGKYRCKCGYAFQRTVSDYWTENPFNTTFKEGGADACNKKCSDKIRERLKEKACPKCGETCNNLDPK